jgi:hypothetical protein
MLIALLTISFFSCCLYFNKIYKIPYLQTPFLYFSLVILIEYLFGILGFLLYGYYVATIFGIIMLFLLRYKNDNLFDKKNVVNIPLILVPILLSLIIVDSNYILIEWDDFANWGKSIKWIYDNNALYTGDAFVSIKRYPPASQLFQYFILKTFGWKESYLILSVNLLTISGILFIFSYFNNQFNFKNIIGMFVVFLMIFTFGYGYADIYVDKLLGIVFSITLVLALSYEKTKENFILFIITTSLLLIIKETALILCAISLFVYFTDFYRSDKNNIIYKRIFIILLFNSFFYFSWKLYLNSIGTHLEYSLPQFHQLFEDKFINRFSLTMHEFYRRISSRRYLAVFTVLTSLLIIIKYSKFDRNHLRSIYIIFLGIVIYIFCLLMFYLFIFGDFEGPRLASFERYLGSYLLAVAILLISIIWSIDYKYKKIVLSVLSLLIIAINFKHLNRHFPQIQNSKSDVEFRILMSNYTNALKKYLQPGDKVFFISQHTVGYESVMFTYLNLPFASNGWCWSVGIPKDKNDVWTCPRKLEDELRGSQGPYKFIVLFSFNDSFWEPNKHLFTISYPKKGIYIIKEENSKINIYPLNLDENVFK